MHINTKIALTVSSLILTGIIVGLVMTYGLTCKGPWFGYGCDALIQSAAQLLGAVATIVAVVVTINYGRARDSETQDRQLAAIAHEILLISVRFKDRKSLLETVSKEIKSGVSPDSRAARVIGSVLADGEFHIYQANSGAVAHLNSRAAALTIRAMAEANNWNSYCRGNLAAIENGYKKAHEILSDCAASAERRRQLCLRATRAIQQQLQIRIEGTDDE